jgi:hypothetical protein
MPIPNTINPLFRKEAFDSLAFKYGDDLNIKDYSID